MWKPYFGQNLTFQSTGVALKIRLSPKTKQHLTPSKQESSRAVQKVLVISLCSLNE